ncbi:MAG: ATP-grasp domain-containing protein [Candidatus Dormibacteria bacterium]
MSPFPKTGHSSRALVASPEVRDCLLPGTRALVVWKSSVAVERAALELGIPLANSPAALSRQLENKAFFTPAAKAAGLPVPRAVTGAAGPALAASAERLGLPLVFQLAHGFSGAQTYPIESLERLRELNATFAGHQSRIAERVEGSPVTVTGVVQEDSVICGPPCLQLTGIPFLTPHPLGSCGNDFSAAIPHRQLVAATAGRVGEWLKEQGHRGIFGVDLVVSDGGDCWCIEVNPRLVASVPLWSLSARDLGHSSLLERHLACFGSSDSDSTPLSCHWSQLILYRIAADPGPDPAATSRGRIAADGSFDSGGPLSLRGPGPGELGLVVRGSTRTGAELARLLTDGPLLDERGQLLPQLAKVVARLRGSLESTQ